MTTILEIHGIRATRMRMPQEPYAVDVLVKDGLKFITLNVDEWPIAIGLTADEARWLADELMLAAGRMEGRAERE